MPTTTNPAYYYADPAQMTTLTGQNRGGSNAWLWTPTEQNTTYDNYALGGQNNYITPEVGKFLQALGYSGSVPLGGALGSGADASALADWMAQRGLSLQTGTHHVPGYTQQTHIQRIIDSNGNPVAVDANNDRYDWGDRLTDAAKVAGIAAAGYGLGSYAGLWGGGEAAGAAAGEALAPGLKTVADIGGTALQPLTQAAIGPGLSVPSLAELGVPAIAPGLTGEAGKLALDYGIKSAVDGFAPRAQSLLEQLKYSDTTKSIKNIADAWSASKTGTALAGLAGAALGAASGGGNETSTRAYQMDPRMDAYVYGSGPDDPNSYLGGLRQQYLENPSGINPTMQQALDIGKANLTDPAYSQTFQNMRDTGNRLLTGPMAGNPFAAPQSQPGGLPGASGGQTFQMPAGAPVFQGAGAADNLIQRGQGLLAVQGAPVPSQPSGGLLADYKPTGPAVKLPRFGLLQGA